MLRSSSDSSVQALSAFERTLAAARSGNPREVGCLLDVYRNYLLNIAAQKLPDCVGAKVAPSDVVQDSLLEASQTLDKFRGSSELELRAWLKKIVARRTIDVYRRWKGFAKRDVSRELVLDQVGGSSRIDPGGVGNSPSEQIGADEQLAQLRIALKGLPAEHREVIQLRTFQQLSFDEIGKRLGRSSEAARKLWARALHSLTQRFRSHESHSC